MIEIHFVWLIGLVIFSFMCGQIEEARQWRKRLNLKTKSKQRKNEKE